jgi:hypothetical protein
MKWASFERWGSLNATDPLWHLKPSLFAGCLQGSSTDQEGWFVTARFALRVIDWSSTKFNFSLGVGAVNRRKNTIKVFKEVLLLFRADLTSGLILALTVG